MAECDGSIVLWHVLWWSGEAESRSRCLDEAVQAVEREMEPKLAAFFDQVFQNEALFKRMERMLAEQGLPAFSEKRIEVIGAEDMYGPHARPTSREVVLKMAIKTPSKATAELFAREGNPAEAERLLESFAVDSSAIRRELQGHLGKGAGVSSRQNQGKQKFVPAEQEREDRGGGQAEPSLAAGRLDH